MPIKGTRGRRKRSDGHRPDVIASTSSLPTAVPELNRKCGGWQGWLQPAQLLQQALRVRDAGGCQRHRLPDRIVIDQAGLVEGVEDFPAELLPGFVGPMASRARREHQDSQRQLGQQLLVRRCPRASGPLGRRAGSTRLPQAEVRLVTAEGTALS